MNKHIENNASFSTKESATFLSKLFEIFFIDLYDSSRHDVNSKTSFANATRNLDDSLRRLDEMFNGERTEIERNKESDNKRIIIEEEE